MPAAKIGDLVAVEWEDAWADSSESSEQSWRDDYPVVTYGILKRRGNIITVVSEELPDGMYRDASHIPRSIVKRIRKLA